MTDGLCKANIHRVIFPPSKSGELPTRRRSIAYFSTPSHDIVTESHMPVLEFANMHSKIMNPVKPGGIIIETQGICAILHLTPRLIQIDAMNVGEFFQERQRLAGIS
jgi:hypothetical protein